MEERIKKPVICFNAFWTSIQTENKVSVLYFEFDTFTGWKYHTTLNSCWNTSWRILFFYLDQINFICVYRLYTSTHLLKWSLIERQHFPVTFFTSSTFFSSLPPFVLFIYICKYDLRGRIFTSFIQSRKEKEKSLK